ncbi:MAG: hypothetical protein HC899_32820 [Leptolyngbyaceae cyanobacterium SM1_4_3]|nr:hypothetical protein [Leptolyngbyaceae cyanobacterium SM1_4_3]
MKLSTERIILRWVHILLSFPIVGYIYEPVADRSYEAFAIKFIYIPIVVLSGLWMWKGQVIRQQFKR